MKSTLFQIGKKLISFQNIQQLPESFHVTLGRIFGIDKNVI